MKIIISKSTGFWKSSSNPSISVTNGTNTISHLFFGEPLLYDDTVFNSASYDLIVNKNSSEFIPRLSGNYFYMQIEENRVKDFAVDFYGHSRMYILESDEKIFISDSIYELKEHHDKVQLDFFQIYTFLSKGYTWNGGTFFKRLEIITPSKLYSIKSGEVSKEYLKLPDYNFEGKTLSEITGNVLEELSKANDDESIDMMFSGGQDSSFLAFVAKERKLNYQLLFTIIEKPQLLPNLEDTIRNRKMKQNFGFNIIERKIDAYEVLSTSFNQTLELLPFEFHVSIFQKDLIEYTHSNNKQMIVTGQNSDSLYNYGKTAYISPKLTLSKLFSGKLRGSGITVLLDRYFQTSGFHKRLMKNSNYSFERLLWKKINVDIPLSPTNLLAGFIASDEVLPKVRNDLISKILNTDGENAFYEKLIKESNEVVNNLIKGSEKSMTFRDALLRSKLLGHCQGRDVRCITQWSKEYNLVNCQIYSTAPIYTKLSKIRISWKDILRPKREIYKYLKKKTNYFKEKELNYGAKDNKQESYKFSTEQEYLNSLYESLRKDFELDYHVDVAIKTLMISDDVEKSQLEKEYKENLTLKFKLAWLGFTVENYCK